MTWCSRCGDIQKKKPVGHTQRCKEYRRNYYLKNKEAHITKIKEWKKNNPDKWLLAVKKSVGARKKYYQIYSKYYYLKKILENPNYARKNYEKRKAKLAKIGETVGSYERKRKAKKRNSDSRRNTGES